MIVLKPFIAITDGREVVSGEWTARGSTRAVLESASLRGSMHHEDDRFFILITA